MGMREKTSSVQNCNKPYLSKGTFEGKKKLISVIYTLTMTNQRHLSDPSSKGTNA